eukprot:SAG31_NODE_17431_length_670_cov_8.408056_1_plen_99_part_00
MMIVTSLLPVAPPPSQPPAAPLPALLLRPAAAGPFAELRKVPWLLSRVGWRRRRHTTVTTQTAMAEHTQAVMALLRVTTCQVGPFQSSCAIRYRWVSE